MSLDPECKYKVQLSLFPNGRLVEESRFVVPALRLLSSPRERTSIEYEMRIGAGGTVYKLTGAETKEFMRGESHIPERSLLRETLKREKSNLMPDNVLTLFCKLKTIVSVDSSSFVPTTLIRMRDEPKTALREMFEKKEFSDVIIICQNQGIPAHKAFLAARSSYFASLFRSPWQENQSGTVSVSEPYNLMNEILRFLYTGEVPMLSEMAEEMLIAGDKYDLSSLKQCCEHHLVKNLSTENLASAFVLSDMAQAKSLEAEAQKLFEQNAHEVIKSDGWKQLAVEHPDISEKVMHRLLAEHATLVGGKKRKCTSS